MSDTRQHVHELIDRLRSSQLVAVAGLLEAMLDPVSRAIANAPPDDEPVADEDRRRSAKVKPGSPSAVVRAFRWRKSLPNSALSPETSPSQPKTPSNAGLPN